MTATNGRIEFYKSLPWREITREEAEKEIGVAEAEAKAREKGEGWVCWNAAGTVGCLWVVDRPEDTRHWLDRLEGHF